MPNLFTLPGTRDGPDTVGAMQTLAFNEVRTVAAGTKIYSSLQTLFWADHNHASVINFGRIWNISPTNVSGAITGYYVPEVQNHGLLVSEAPNGNAYAIGVSSGGALVRNTGQIYAIGNGNAGAVQHWDPSVVVDNSGLIAAYAPSGSSAGVGDAFGVALFNGGNLVNRIGGSILAEGLSATAVIFGRGNHLDPGSAEIRNFGLIEAFAIDAAKESVAILTAALTVEHMRIENWGIIRAEVAYRSEVELGWSPPQQPSDQLTNFAGGEIHGLIDTRLGADILINRGLVRGEVRMGEGDDLVDTRVGTLDGKVDLGWGDDRFDGGESDEAVLGGRDHDWLEGNGGNDLLLGGLGDDTLFGGAGNDGLYGEHGDDRIIAAGGDRIEGGAGNDVIEARDLGFALVAGGAGSDRLVLAMGADSLDLAAVLASGRVTDIEEIQSYGDQRLVVRAGDAAGLSGGENMLRLLMGATDSVELIGAWVEGVTVMMDGIALRRFDLGGETILVSGPASVLVAAAPSTPAGGLDPVAGGPTAPLAGSVPGVGLSSTTTILNNYDLHDDETIQSYETWRSSDGNPVITPIYLHSLVNYGLMESQGTGNGGAKVVFAWNIARIENHGTMRAIGTPTNGAQVVYSVSWSAVTNYGLIEALATQAGSATGLELGGSWYDGIVLLNHGTIRAIGNAAERAVGVSMRQDDAGYNHGTIEALGGGGTIGALAGGLRQFTNSGTITADLLPGATGEATGILFIPSIWGSTLYNEGLVRGTIALDSRGGLDFDRNLAVDNAGRLEGTVRLDDGDNRVDNRGTVTGEVTLGAGVDLWHGGRGEQLGQVLGGAGTDMLVGGAGADRLSGEDGDDYLNGGGGVDLLSGGAGRDTFVYRALGESTEAAFDTITDFTTGLDRIDLSALDAHTIFLTNGPGYTQLLAHSASGTLSVRVVGTIGLADLVTTRASVIGGSGGADLLVATDGGSTLLGNDGVDVLIGSAANDRLEGGGGRDYSWGGAGDDVYVVDLGYEIVWEAAGEGNDTIELVGVGQSLTMTDNVENLVMMHAGYATGSGQANSILGSSGDDGLNGAGGDDLLEGRGGNDFLVGGEGQDTASYESAGAAVNVTLVGETAQNTGGAGTDTLLEIENLIGSRFDDSLTGNALDNVLKGGGGADLLVGDAGEDIAVYAGSRFDYEIDTSGEFVRVRDMNAADGDDGIDTLDKIELIRFADMIVQLGVDTNNLPQLGDPDMVDQVWLDGAAASYQIPGTSFIDIDGQHTLDFVATLADGSPLPGWLSFDPETRTFQGTPPLDHVGTTLTIKVTAADVGGSVSDEFQIEILQAPGQDVFGTDGPDTLAGTFRDEILFGDDGDDILRGSAGADRLDGHAGTDTADYSNSPEAVVVNMLTGFGVGGDADGDWLISIENVTGSAFDDRIVAGADFNLINGGAGADLMEGGLGQDIYLVDDEGDFVIEAGPDAGFDTVISSISYTLSDHVERLTLTGSGPLNGTGNAGANLITGNDGANILDGGLGADTLAGGLGDDIYLVDGGDLVIEQMGAGADEVRTALAAYSLAAEVERLTGTTNAGQALTGNGLANLITGGWGNDLIDGGLGADDMRGSLGNDVYLVDNAGDTVTEGDQQGRDEVRTNLASYSLAGLTYVENLTGGAADQSLTGNGQNNLIDGGAGADAMAGGGGHDIYIVDNLGDTVIEIAGAGTDEVRTGLGSKAPPERAVYVLPNFIENLTGTSAGAQGVRDNALNNVITMGIGHDLVVADAGGIDTINAGLGNDFVYYGDKLTVADTTNGGAGADTISLLGNYGSGITFTAANLIGVERMALYTSLYLPGTGPNNYTITMNDANVAAGTEFFVTAASLQSNEALTFNGAAESDGRFTVHGGGGADTITGGAGGDFIIGNAGNDSLFGLGGVDFLIGGLGADQLRGGSGVDRFVYQSAAQSTTGSADQILDFQHGDRIDLTAIDANANGADGNSAFTFIGSDAFHNVAGELRAYQSGGDWFVEGDVNGDGLADLVIQVTLPDATPLGAGDFFL